MKNGKAQIGYGYILVPPDFPDYDTTPKYDEWEDELLNSGYFHYVGPDHEMFFGLISAETDSFTELDLDIFDRYGQSWFDCENTFERLFPDSDSFHSWYLLEGYDE